MATGSGADPYENDPARWGHSLANVAEILLECLDTISAQRVAEIGAYAGDLTRVLLAWAAETGAQVTAIDPSPHERLVELCEQHPELDLIRKPSLEALVELPLPDALIIDGDHNYYTVSEELNRIGDRAPGQEIPLLLFHDVGWPHGRRDAYWNLDGIPEEHRQPTLERLRIFPGNRGVVDHGMPMYSAAVREGGSRNGVRTAVEEFVDRRGDLRLVILPPFFGVGVAWHRDAPWTQAIADLVEPWDRHPVLERLEANRVYQLAIAHARAQKLRWATEALESQREENANLKRLLQERGAEIERLRSTSAGHRER